MNNLEKEIITNEEFDLICEYIKIRNKAKMSQQELANRTGLAQSTIARMEKNLHSASLATFIKILNALNYKIVLKEKQQEEK